MKKLLIAALFTVAFAASSLSAWHNGCCRRSCDYGRTVSQGPWELYYPDDCC